MTTQETYQVNRVWTDLVVAGRPAQIDQFLTEIERLLPKEWARKTEKEQESHEILKRQGWTGQPSRCYSRTLANSEVWLWLNRRSTYRVHGGLVEPAVPKDNAESICDFHQRVLEPAAKLSGLTISRYGLGPLSWVTVDVMNRLWAFYDSSEFRWPPTGEALRRWREFVVSAYQTHAAFDTNEFRHWLVEKGWKASDAQAMFDQLLTDAALLSEYDDLRQPV